ncbi:MAG TPA: GTPase, partial [Planctomycetaceae bacterium]|nr:GTPase [Planctomycetaceae bacterium]
MNEITNERGRAAMLTPAGRGAVATILLRGSSQQIERAGFAPAARMPLSEQPIRRLWFGFWGETTSEEVVLGRLDEREWELHCHGGYAAVARILNSLREQGWETSDWKELFAQDEPFPVVEHREALAHAATWKTTETLLRHTPQRFVEALNELRTEVDSTDWSDERSRSWAERWTRMLTWRSFGRHLTIPFRVILAGEPKVGKSSLLNRLAGFERAIVHDRPGTTRDVVRTLCAFDGWPFELSDTAGIRAHAEPLESLGIEKSLAEIASADLVLFLVDVSRPPVPAEEDCLQNCPRFLRIG